MKRLALPSNFWNTSTSLRKRLRVDAGEVRRNDARKIAQLMRLGSFRPVHCESITARNPRHADGAQLVQSKLLDVENSLRGILRSFGLKVGISDSDDFAGTHSKN